MRRKRKAKKPAIQQKSSSKKKHYYPDKNVLLKSAILHNFIIGQAYMQNAFMANLINFSYVTPIVIKTLAALINEEVSGNKAADNIIDNYSLIVESLVSLVSSFYMTKVLTLRFFPTGFLTYLLDKFSDKNTANYLKIPSSEVEEKKILNYFKTKLDSTFFLLVCNFFFIHSLIPNAVLKIKYGLSGSINTLIYFFINQLNYSSFTAKSCAKIYADNIKINLNKLTEGTGLEWQIRVDEYTAFEVKTHSDIIDISYNNLNGVYTDIYFKYLKKAIADINPAIKTAVDSEGLILTNSYITPKQAEQIKAQHLKYLSQWQDKAEQKLKQKVLIQKLSEATGQALIWYRGETKKNQDGSSTFTTVSNQITHLSAEHKSHLYQILIKAFGQANVTLTNERIIISSIPVINEQQLVPLQEFCHAVAERINSIASTTPEILCADQPSQVRSYYTNFFSNKTRYIPVLNRFFQKKENREHQEDWSKSLDTLQKYKLPEDVPPYDSNVNFIEELHKDSKSKVTIPLLENHKVSGLIVIKNKNLNKLSDKGNYLLKLLAVELKEGGTAGHNIKKLKNDSKLYREEGAHYKIRFFGKNTSGDERGLLIPSFFAKKMDENNQQVQKELPAYKFKARLKH